jgi:hypothetical protein
VLPLIGRRGRTSPAWLEAAIVPITILERAGLRGARLARAHLWLTETTVALVMQEAALPLAEQLRGARSALRELPAARSDLLAPLLGHLDDEDADTTFAFATERTIDALRVLIDGR